MKQKKIYYIVEIVVAVLFVIYVVIYALHKYDTSQSSSLASNLHQQAVAEISNKKGDPKEPKNPNVESDIQEYGAILEKIQETNVKKALLEQEIALRQVENELKMARKELGMDAESIRTSSMDDGMMPSENPVYKFVMVKQRHGEWHATFSRDGKIYKVKKGDTLLGRYKVHDINEHGTVLKKGDEEFVQVF